MFRKRILAFLNSNQNCRRFKYVAIFLICINLFLSSLYVFFGDIYWDSDIARDFLILDEIAQKKLVLIGPRSFAAPGLFHGPAWAYLNFPAFYIGQGNPIAVGWFWVFLNGLFLISCFLIVRRLFTSSTAYIFTLLVSLRMIGFTKGMTNPNGAMYVILLFFYFLIRYIQTQKLSYLSIHILLGGLIFQFQLAIGAPFILLSFLYVLLWLHQHNKAYRHLLAYGLFCVFLLTYIVFDVRHNFLMFQGIKNYLNLNSVSGLPFSVLFLDRLQILVQSGFIFFQGEYSFLNIFLFILMAVIVILQSQKFDYRYKIYWYFLIGFYVFSFTQRSELSPYYYVPLFPLVFLVFILTISRLPKYVFYGLIMGIFVFNLGYEFHMLRQNILKIGLHQLSWQFHNNIAQDIFAEAKEKEFGLFIYSPEQLGYKSKYPLIYQQQRQPEKKLLRFVKKPETFVIIAGPPEYAISGQFAPEAFIHGAVRINSLPVQTLYYPEQYVNKKFVLTTPELECGFDLTVANWLTYR